MKKGKLPRDWRTLDEADLQPKRERKQDQKRPKPPLRKFKLK